MRWEARQVFIKPVRIVAGRRDRNQAFGALIRHVFQLCVKLLIILNLKLHGLRYNKGLLRRRRLLGSGHRLILFLPGKTDLQNLDRKEKMY